MTPKYHAVLMKRTDYGRWEAVTDYLCKPPRMMLLGNLTSTEIAWLNEGCRHNYKWTKVTFDPNQQEPL